VLVALSTALLVSLPVGGDARCPTPPEVQAALDGVLPSSGRAGDSASVDALGDGVRVSLRDVRGAVIAERVFFERTGCDTLAQAAALLIAAWETETPAGEKPDAPSKLNEPEDAPGTALVARAGSQTEAWPFEICAGVVGSWADAAAVGGLLEGAAGPPGRWAAVASLEGDSSRNLSFSHGSVGWQRWQAGLGARFRLTHSPELSLQGEAVGAALTMTSEGFQTNGSALQIEPGGRGSARLAIHAGSFIFWAQVSADGWFNRQFAAVQNVQGQLQLPRYEVLAALGVGVGRP
jgi:hypothetical protein